MSLGRWLKQRRKALDLTQEYLAERVGCAVETIRKIEGGTRRPSRQIAERLAEQLLIAPQEQAAFVQWARAAADSGAALASPDVTPWHAPPLTSNLPTPLTPLLGRDPDVASVQQLLMRANVRVVTLVGPPGVGKTRLGLAVAASERKHFRDDVWWVALAPIGDAALVLTTIAQVFGIQDASDQQMITMLQAHLRHKQVLLLLDNVEHIVQAAPHLAALLMAVPDLKLLVTSRVPLHISGEHEYAVAPLALPELNRLPAPEHLRRYAAVELFVQRAQAVNATFALAEPNAEAVATICARLDGLPLAIELAAARCKLLTPQRLAAGMHGEYGNPPLQLLTTGACDLAPHQQTLRSAIAWSYALLNPAEQRLFRRLGVFAGSFTMAAAAAVCQAAGDCEIDIVEGLASLADKSLIQQRATSNGEVRCAMLETLREYAVDQLYAHTEYELMRRYHADYFVTLAEAASQQLKGLNQLSWITRLETEHDNLRAALHWLFAGEQVELGLRLASALWLFWHMHGHLNEGQYWLERGIHAGGAATLQTRARALNGAGWLAMFRGEYQTATLLLQDSLLLFRSLDDTDGIATALTNLGFVALLGLCNLETVPALFSEAMSLLPHLHNQRTIANVYLFAGLRAGIQGDWEQAESCHHQSLAVYRQIGDTQGSVMCLVNLGLLALARDGCAEANTLLHKALHLTQGIDEKMSDQFALFGLAGVALKQGHPQRAVRLWGASHAMREASGIQLTPLAQARTNYQGLSATAHIQLGEATFTAAWEEGCAMSPDAAVAYALQEMQERTATA